MKTKICLLKSPGNLIHFFISRKILFSRIFTVLLVLILFSPAYIFSASPQKSEIIFHVTHPLKKVTGICENIEFKDFNYNVTDEKLQISNPFIVFVTVEGMTTGNGNRDSNMYHDLGFPEYKIIEADIQKVSVSQNNHYRVNGILKIKGKERPFETEGTLTKEGSLHMFKGHLSVKLSDFGVERPTLLVAIDDVVAVDFQFVL